MIILYKDNDNLLTLEPLKNMIAGTFVNDATVTFVVKEDTDGAAGSAITGASGSMPYVASSDGKYQGIVESTAALVLGRAWLGMTFSSASMNGYIEEICEVRRRGSKSSQ